MTLLIAGIGALLWFLIFALVLRARQSQRARVRQRLFRLILAAEKERAETARKEQAAKNQEPLPVHHTLQELSFTERVLRPILNSVEVSLAKLAPAELQAMLEQQIFRAGKQEQWTVPRLAACWVISAILGFLLAFLLVQSHPALKLPQGIILLLLGIAAGGAVPFLILQSAARKRKAALRRQLPEFLDLLCVSVQAGLSFDGAVAKITSRMKGVLTDEFQHMQRDTSLGMTRQRSLMQMAKRCDIEEFYLFTSSVIQAERLGTSMTRTLKVQADNMRDRHRQYVRSQAMKAPVKIIFPMVFFIFPAVFVVVIFPAVLSLLNSLGR